MLERARPQATHELPHDLALSRFLERGQRHHEVARLRQALRADGPELRQAERRTVVLAHIAARLPLEEGDLELHAARYDGDLARRELQPAELRENQQPALLRTDHQLAIRATQ